LKEATVDAGVVGMVDVLGMLGQQFCRCQNGTVGVLAEGRNEPQLYRQQEKKK
jgi:hypothetical protein